jgi:PLP dependent protein
MAVAEDGGVARPAAPPPTVEAVRAGLAAVHDRVRAAGGDLTSVAVLAVTKTWGPEVVPVARAAGLRLLGENYAQELVVKAAWLAERGEPAPEWHFIGQLQANKVRMLAPHVACYQTVDRASLVAELARRAPGARCLVQVNTSGEPHKGGCEPGEAEGLCAAAAGAGLAVEGLMTVGPTPGAGEPAPCFRLLRRLTDGLGLAVCSMGMSDDLEVAVAEGSTLLRLGTALFGARAVPSRRPGELP